MPRRSYSAAFCLGGTKEEDEVAKDDEILVDLDGFKDGQGKMFSEPAKNKRVIAFGSDDEKERFAQEVPEGICLGDDVLDNIETFRKAVK